MASEKETAADALTDKAENDEYEGDTLEDLDNEEGGMSWAHVMIPKQHESLKAKVVVQIGTDIESNSAFPKDCCYVVEYDTPAPGNSDLLRLWVAFLDEQHLALFQQQKVVKIPTEDGKGSLNFQITQPGIQWGNATETDGSVRVLVKNLPKSLGPNRLERLFDKFKWGKAERPMVVKASGAQFLTHKGGVPRAMMVATIVPHDDDPECESVLPVVRIPTGKGKGSSTVVTMIVGCSKHTCEICLKSGHLSAVHEKFADRSTLGKRRAAGGLIKDAKRRAVVPESAALRVVIDDPVMEFVENKGLSKEAWRCNVCVNKQGGPRFGLDYAGAINHAMSAEHKEKAAGESVAGG